MVTWSHWLEAGPAVVVGVPGFGGLGTGGLIAVIVIAVILIAAVVWLINGTKKRE